MRTHNFVDTTPFIAGWGRIKEGGERSTILLQGQLKVVANNVCKEKIRKTGALKKEYQFDKYVMCAGAPGIGM